MIVEVIQLLKLKFLQKIIVLQAICPSGASTGTYEAFEKRDKNNKKYLGKSVFNAINLINTKISKKIKRSKYT